MKLAAIAKIVGRSVKRRPPKFKIGKCRKCHARGWDGRYRPETRTVHLAAGWRTAPKTRALLAYHELAHFAAYERARGKGKTYAGKHDRAFYAELRRIHRRFKVPAADARDFERKSGYHYQAGKP